MTVLINITTWSIAHIIFFELKYRFSMKPSAWQ